MWKAHATRRIFLAQPHLWQWHGQHNQSVDTAGINTYTYNSRDMLATLTDPVTGTTRAYDYNDAAQTCLITYAQTVSVPGIRRDGLPVCSGCTPLRADWFVGRVEAGFQRLGRGVRVQAAVR